MTPTLLAYMNTSELALPLPESQTQVLAAELASLSSLQVYARSITAVRRSILFLGRQGDEKYLGILSAGIWEIGFTGQTKSVAVDETELDLTICPITAVNAAALRAVLPFL